MHIIYLRFISYQQTITELTCSHCFVQRKTGFFFFHPIECGYSHSKDVKKSINKINLGLFQDKI